MKSFHRPQECLFRSSFSLLIAFLILNAIGVALAQRSASSVTTQEINHGSTVTGAPYTSSYIIANLSTVFEASRAEEICGSVGEGYTLATIPTAAANAAIATAFATSGCASAAMSGMHNTSVPPMLAWSGKGRLSGLLFSDISGNARSYTYSNISFKYSHVPILFTSLGQLSFTADLWQSVSPTDLLSCVVCERSPCKSLLDSCPSHQQNPRFSNASISGYYPNCTCGCASPFYGPNCTEFSVDNQYYVSNYAVAYSNLPITLDEGRAMCRSMGASGASSRGDLLTGWDIATVVSDRVAGYARLLYPLSMWIGASRDPSIQGHWYWQSGRLAGQAFQRGSVLDRQPMYPSLNATWRRFVEYPLPSFVNWLANTDTDVTLNTAAFMDRGGYWVDLDPFMSSSSLWCALCERSACLMNLDCFAQGTAAIAGEFYPECRCTCKAPAAFSGVNGDNATTKAISSVEGTRCHVFTAHNGIYTSEYTIVGIRNNTRSAPGGWSLALAEEHCAAAGEGFHPATVVGEGLALQAMLADTFAVMGGRKSNGSCSFEWAYGRLKGAVFINLLPNMVGRVQNIPVVYRNASFMDDNYATHSVMCDKSAVFVPVVHPTAWDLVVEGGNVTLGATKIPSVSPTHYACERSPCNISIDCTDGWTAGVNGYFPNCVCQCLPGASGPRCNVTFNVAHATGYVTEYAVVKIVKGATAGTLRDDYAASCHALNLIEAYAGWTTGGIATDAVSAALLRALNGSTVLTKSSPVFVDLFSVPNATSEIGVTPWYIPSPRPITSYYYQPSSRRQASRQYPVLWQDGFGTWDSCVGWRLPTSDATFLTTSACGLTSYPTQMSPPEAQYGVFTALGNQRAVIGSEPSEAPFGLCARTGCSLTVDCVSENTWLVSGTFSNYYGGCSSCVCRTTLGVDHSSFNFGCGQMNNWSIGYWSVDYAVSAAGRSVDYAVSAAGLTCGASSPEKQFATVPSQAISRHVRFANQRNPIVIGLAQYDESDDETRRLTLRWVGGGSAAITSPFQNRLVYSVEWPMARSEDVPNIDVNATLGVHTCHTYFVPDINLLHDLGNPRRLARTFQYCAFPQKYPDINFTRTMPKWSTGTIGSPPLVVMDGDGMWMDAIDYRVRGGVPVMGPQSAVPSPTVELSPLIKPLCERISCNLTADCFLAGTGVMAATPAFPCTCSCLATSWGRRCEFPIVVTHGRTASPDAHGNDQWGNPVGEYTSEYAVAYAHGNTSSMTFPEATAACAALQGGSWHLATLPSTEAVAVVAYALESDAWIGLDEARTNWAYGRLANTSALPVTTRRPGDTAPYTHCPMRYVQSYTAGPSVAIEDSACSYSLPSHFKMDRPTLRQRSSFKAAVCERSRCSLALDCNPLGTASLGAEPSGHEILATYWPNCRCVCKKGYGGFRCLFTTSATLSLSSRGSATVTGTASMSLAAATTRTSAERASATMGGFSRSLRLLPTQTVSLVSELPPPTGETSVPVPAHSSAPADVVYLPIVSNTETTATISVIGSAVGGAVVAVDAQTIAMVSMVSCATKNGEAKADESMRSLSVVALDDTCEGVIVGNTIVVVAVAGLSAAAVVILRVIISRRALPADPYLAATPLTLQAMATLRTPHLLLTVGAYFMNSYAVCGLRVMRNGFSPAWSDTMRGPNPTASLVGALALLFPLLLVLSFPVMAFLFGTRRLLPVRYQWPSRPLSLAGAVALPAWVLDDTIRTGPAFGAVFAAYRRLHPLWSLTSHASFVATLPVVLATEGSGTCGPFFSVSAGLYFVACLVVLALRPRRILLGDVLHAAMLLVNGLVITHSAVLLYHPEEADSGTSEFALEQLSSAVTVLTVLRVVHQGLTLTVNFTSKRGWLKGVEGPGSAEHEARARHNTGGGRVLPARHGDDLEDDLLEMPLVEAPHSSLPMSPTTPRMIMPGGSSSRSPPSDNNTHNTNFSRHESRSNGAAEQWVERHVYGLPSVVYSGRCWPSLRALITQYPAAGSAPSVVGLDPSGALTDAAADFFDLVLGGEVAPHMSTAAAVGGGPRPVHLESDLDSIDDSLEEEEEEGNGFDDMKDHTGGAIATTTAVPPPPSSFAPRVFVSRLNKSHLHQSLSAIMGEDGDGFGLFLSEDDAFRRQISAEVSERQINELLGGGAPHI